MLWVLVTLAAAAAQTARNAMQSSLTGTLSHCLGEVTIADGAAQMRAAVRRDVRA